jgi:hypothetical protein
MQQNPSLVGKLPPHVTLDLLIDTHGAWKITRALVATLLRRRQRRLGHANLSDHLRRDVGLPERYDPPPRLQGPVM